MERFEKRRPELEAAGARVAAISVDPIEKSQELARGHELRFPLLSDEAAEVIKAYGVFHGERRISLPSIFVVDSTGVVRWRYVSRSVTDRPDEDDVVAAVKKLKGS